LLTSYIFCSYIFCDTSCGAHPVPPFTPVQPRVISSNQKATSLPTTLNPAHNTRLVVYPLQICSTTNRRCRCDAYVELQSEDYITLH